MAKNGTPKDKKNRSKSGPNSSKDTPAHKPKGPRGRGGPRGKNGSKTGGKNFRRESTTLGEVAVLIVSGQDEDGATTALPAKWESQKAPPHIVVLDTGRNTAVAKGDRILARLRKINPHTFQALVIRILPDERPRDVVGVFIPTAEGGIIEPITRKMKESFLVAREDMNGALPQEVVCATTLPGTPSMSMSYAKITERLGRIDAPRAASLIAAHMHELPSIFPEAAIAESEEASSPVMGEDRTDLRHIPLVTIDGEDARDFDDAVFAERDGDGWHVIVAIADVAYYVAEGSALDEEALDRGNSVYFPDRVIPMLPERLSNGLCSLKPDEDRYCLAVHMWFDAHGHMKKYHFVRSLMRSVARLTYTIAQEAHDHKAHALYEKVIAPLYGAYAALAHERDSRGALDLNLPEFKILFDANGEVAEIAPRERLESHRLIEAFMIAANVAAADYLLGKNLPAVYRVHEPPAEEKLEELKNLLKAAGFGLHVGAGIKAAHFNRVLKAVQGKPEEFLVNTAI
ncbi:MAG: ribonuclease R, partial [Rickettsiales bacterium]|nr:ribonuclease R [Rickettsiales bacterium]